MSLKEKLKVSPIPRHRADELCRSYHYSGKPYVKSQVHLGVYWDGELEGAMCFGCPIDRRKVLPLVEGTGWEEMCELNRMAFSDNLPRNSESRALSVAFRLFRKYAPQVKWILSYADGAQSGSGAIYRATGWILTQIKENSSLYRRKDGSVVSDIGIRTSATLREEIGGGGVEAFRDAGLQRIVGRQYRYIKPLTKGLILNCAVLPYDRARPMEATR